MIIYYNNTSINFKYALEDKSWPVYEKTYTIDLSNNINTTIKKKTIYRSFWTRFISMEFWNNEVIPFIDWIARGNIVTIDGENYKLSPDINDFNLEPDNALFSFRWKFIKQ